MQYDDDLRYYSVFSQWLQYPKDFSNNYARKCTCTFANLVNICPIPITLTAIIRSTHTHTQRAAVQANSAWRVDV